jgi:hypothetical protein
MPPRLTVSRLSRLTCASTLAAEFAARLARQRGALRALEPLPGASTALDRLLRAHDEAQAACASGSPAAAVAPLEVGTGAAVESLRTGADADVAHAVLRRAFGTLVAARVVGWRHDELTAGEAGGVAGGGGGMFAAGAVDLAALAEASVDDVCHTGLEPRTSRPQAGLVLLLARVSLALDRRRPSAGRSTARRPRRSCYSSGSRCRPTPCCSRRWPRSPCTRC